MGVSESMFSQFRGLQGDRLLFGLSSCLHPHFYRRIGFDRQSIDRYGARWDRDFSRGGSFLLSVKNKEAHSLIAPSIEKIFREDRRR